MSTEKNAVAAAWQTTMLGHIDTWVARLNPCGTQLEYSTYLGGSGNDYGAGIAADSAGNAYITGLTSSTDFPVSGAVQENNNGGNDVFITQLDSSGQLAWSTYFGGSSNDLGNALTLTPAGDVLVAGQTVSTDITVTNAIQTASNGSFEILLLQLDRTGSTIKLSTYLGGNDEDRGSAITLDQDGDAWLTGLTRSTDFPTVLPWQSTNAGQMDIFLTKLNTLFAPDGDMNLDGQITLADLLTGYRILFEKSRRHWPRYCPAMPHRWSMVHLYPMASSE